MKEGTKKYLLIAVIAIIAVVGIVLVWPKGDAGAEPSPSPEQADSFLFGSAQTQLDPGQYTLPVEMVKATDHSAASMAASCVKGGTLDVAEDGSATVTVHLGTVTLGTITEWAGDWKYYTEHWDSYEEEGFCDAQYQQPCDFTTTALPTGTVEVDSISFPLTHPEADGMYVNMYVEAMGAHPDGYLQFDFAGAEPVTSSVTVAFGSQDVQLSPGTYKVPIYLMNEYKHEELSAASSAFPAEAELTVREDGTASLVTTMETVTMGPLQDRAYNVHQFMDDSTESEPVAVEVLEEIAKGEGMDNPDTMTPSLIRVEIPDNSLDGVYLQFYVDAMGSSPCAWLRVDYDKAIQESQSRIYKGHHQVFQFGHYDVNVEVTVTDGLIQGVAISAENYTDDQDIAQQDADKMAQVAGVLNTAWNGIKPTQENAAQMYNAINAPEVLDGISGATYSAKGVRDAMMDAFKLDYEEPIVPPESVKPGEYTVEVAYYAEVGEHSLVENDTTMAKVIVAEDGTMRMELNPVSGSAKEPMYIMALNGVYPDNDRTQALSDADCQQTLEDIDFTDEYFPEDTQVSTWISFPMNGAPQAIYYTNMYLYVPAMNNLNGESFGVSFDHGRFSTDICCKVYWDTLSPAA